MKMTSKRKLPVLEIYPSPESTSCSVPRTALLLQMGSQGHVGINVGESKVRRIGHSDEAQAPVASWNSEWASSSNALLVTSQGGCVYLLPD